MDLPGFKKKIAGIVHNLKGVLRYSFCSLTGVLLWVCVVFVVVLKLTGISDWGWIWVFYLLLSVFTGLLCGIVISGDPTKFILIVYGIGSFVALPLIPGILQHTELVTIIVIVNLLGFVTANRWYLENIIENIKSGYDIEMYNIKGSLGIDIDEMPLSYRETIPRVVTKGLDNITVNSSKGGSMAFMMNVEKPDSPRTIKVEHIPCTIKMEPDTRYTIKMEPDTCYTIKMETGEIVAVEKSINTNDN